MKKLLLSVLILIVISIVACQQAKKEVKKERAMEKVEIPKVETTGEAVVDAVGNDLNNVNNVEKELSADELGDLDSGLADVQNI